MKKNILLLTLFSCVSIFSQKNEFTFEGETEFIMYQKVDEPNSKIPMELIKNVEGSITYNEVFDSYRIVNHNLITDTFTKMTLNYSRLSNSGEKIYKNIESDDPMFSEYYVTDNLVNKGSLLITLANSTILQGEKYFVSFLYQNFIYKK